MIENKEPTEIIGAKISAESIPDIVRLELDRDTLGFEDGLESPNCDSASFEAKWVHVISAATKDDTK